MNALRCRSTLALRTACAASSRNLLSYNLEYPNSTHIASHSPGFGLPLRSVQTQVQPFSGTGAAGGKVKGPNDDLLRFLVNSFAQDRDKTSARLLPFKEYSLRRAIQAIKKLPHPIVSSKQAREIQGVGSGIARRIDEFLVSYGKQENQRIVSVEVIDEAKRSLTIKEFTRIFGVGDSKAEKLYEAGCRTFDDIERLGLLKTLNRASQVAYRYVNHLDKNVTQEQAKAVKDAVKSALGPDFEVHLVGAFRRGQPDSPLIELLVFHPHYVHLPTPASSSSSGRKGKARQQDDFWPDAASTLPKSRGRPKRTTTVAQERQDTFLADEVVKRLKIGNVLEATMSENNRRWLGVVRVTSEDGGVSFKRLELHLLPARSKGAALLVLTGDKPFLSHIASAASRLGYHLNEFGLWCWRCNGTPDKTNNSVQSDTEANGKTDATSPDGESQTIEDVSSEANGNGNGYWELLASTSEEEIFEELGLQFVEPERRNFAFISPNERSVRSKA